MTGAGSFGADPQHLVRSTAAWLDRRAGLVFAAMSLIAFLGLLYLGRHGSFFQDEWAFIRIGGLGTLRDWFAPHNEHWSTLPFAAYRVLLNTIGLRSYLPYLGVLLTVHFAVAGAVFVLVRQAAGSWIALLAGGLFLVLGSGYQNLFWAFQIGFAGSTAAGLWAFVAFLHDRPRIGALLLVVSVACSTLGLAFVAGAAGLLLTDARRRRWIVWIVPAVAAFTVWLAVIGHEGLGSQASSLSLANVIDVPRFLILGVLGVVEATSGIHGWLGRAVAALLAAALAVVLARAVARRQPVPPLLAGSVVAFVALYVLIDLGRAQLGDAQAARSRYLYEGAALLLVGCGALIGHRLDPSVRLDPTLAPDLGAHDDTGQLAPDAPRGRWAIAAPWLLVVIAMALTTTGLSYNVGRLRSGARFFAEGAGELRATLDVVDTMGPMLPYDPPPPTRWGIPSPADLQLAIERWGSPMHDIFAPSVVRKPTPRERDRALWRLVGGAAIPARTDGPPGLASVAQLLGPEPPVLPPSGAPTVLDPAGAPVTTTGACDVLYAGGDATTALAPIVAVPDGGAVLVVTDAGGPGSAGLGWLRPPDRFDRLVVDYLPGQWIAVTVPRLQGGSAQLELRPPPGTRAMAVCHP